MNYLNGESITSKELQFNNLYMLKIEEVVEELSVKEMKLLHKILPYFHFEMYCLCENPNEQNLDKVIQMDKSTLAEKITYDYSYVNKLINKLKRLGFIMTTEGGSCEIHYTIHPDLMYEKVYDSAFYRYYISKFKLFNSKFEGGDSHE